MKMDSLNLMQAVKDIFRIKFACTALLEENTESHLGEFFINDLDDLITVDKNASTGQIKTKNTQKKWSIVKQERQTVGISYLSANFHIAKYRRE